jgi:hypothetical protein
MAHPHLILNLNYFLEINKKTRQKLLLVFTLIFIFYFPLYLLFLIIHIYSLPVKKVIHIIWLDKAIVSCY